MMQPTSNSAPAGFRRSVYNFLLNDQQSEGARSSLDRFLFLLILLNLFALLLESAPVLAAEYAQAFYWFDVFSVSVFSVEYLLRIYLAPEDPEYGAAKSPRWAYISSFHGIVDLPEGSEPEVTARLEESFEALRAAGAQVIVSARQPQTVQDWAARDAGVRWQPIDVTDTNSVHTAAQAVLAEGPLDMVLYCAGHYRALRAAQWSLDEMLRHEQVNYTGALQVLDAVLPVLMAQGHGHISLVSSVAGWRGLPQSLAYGPTKAALTHLGESLYMDLQDHGVGVSVIHPGFVATPLTAQNQFSMPALMRPEDAAAAMLRGWARGQFDIHFPKRFTGVLKLLRVLPYALYFPLVRRATGL